MIPYKHQIVGIDKLVLLDEPAIGRVCQGCFALFDEPGAGKTKQVIDAAQHLFLKNEITSVLIVAPGSVRPVWFDSELGELKKHLWENFPSHISEYRGKIKNWVIGDPNVTPLYWIITNYEFIRSGPRLEKLMEHVDKGTLMVLDESSAVKGHNTKQTQACLKLRRLVGRVILLNGTPIANNPGDIYSQANIMDPKILGLKSYYQFRARYAIMKPGSPFPQILGWRGIEEIQERMKPYVLRRLKEDCLDLPPKLPTVMLTATLTEESWDIYKKMRDEFIAWLDTSTVSIAPQAATKVMRLSQITSGFLGGLKETNYDIEEVLPELSLDATRPAWVVPSEDLYPRAQPPPPDHESLPFGTYTAPAPAPSTGPATHSLPPREVGREKLDLFFTWLNEQLTIDTNLKLLVWTRFRPELARLVKEITEKYPQIMLGEIRGGQKKDERGDALRLLDPRTMPTGPVIVAGTPSSGSMGLNLAGAHTVVYFSNDYRLITRQQSEDRVHRPGQVYPVSYYEIVAIGPNGQRTIDHKILGALLNKVNLANQTTSYWRSALLEE